MEWRPYPTNPRTSRTSKADDEVGHVLSVYDATI